MVAETGRREILEELDRIAESQWLRESAALKQLLRYVVERTLAGEQQRLKEYTLGVEVFHRPPDYDPRADAIVRVQASLLRKKLASFYEHEGADSKLRIELPRGGYVPRFVTREAAARPETPPARRFSWLAFAIGAAVASLAAFGIAHWPDTTAAMAAPKHAVWGPMLAPGRKVIVGMGMPLFYTSGTGLYVRDVHRNRGSAWPGETILKMEKALGVRFRIHDDVYTGAGEAMGVIRVSRWLDRYGAAVDVANSHYLGLSDLAGKDLVVVSSARFQTLVNDMKLPAAFVFDETGSGAFRNLHPAPGEIARYEPSHPAGSVSVSHALLTVWPGPSPGTRIIYVSGIHSWSTNGATQFAVDPAKLQDLDRRLASSPEEGPHGKRSPWFQVLLRVEGKNDQVRAVDYVTHKFLTAP